MDYIELTFPGAVQGNILTELLPYWLGDLGFESFYESDTGLKAYIRAVNFNPENMKDHLQRLNGNIVDFTVQVIKEKNWNEEWEKNYEPVLIDDCLIRAPFHATQKVVRYEIVLEPKMSFGTGHHATTVLMIRTMRKMNFSGLSVLDAGSGTGILAILAEKMGASHIVAIDNDPWCFANAAENILRNECRHIELLEKDVKTVETGEFDCILANINRNVLLTTINDFTQMLNASGSFIISGILASDLQDMAKACEKAGLKIVYSEELDNWALLKMVKK
jgi:ribosomal protein L11 methyltransferase